jgi:hypothetical protein
MTDDDGTQAMLELQRSTGYKRLGMAVLPASFAVWWLLTARKEGTLGDAGGWGPAVFALAIAAVIAFAGIAKLAAANAHRK